jgi:hypothetical protein
MTMMRLKVEKVGEGLHPSELVVSIQTRNGPVSMVVDPEVIYSDDTVSVGWPVGREDNFYLVDLPRETIQGAARVWVGRGELKQVNGKKRARA